MLERIIIGEVAGARRRSEYFCGILVHVLVYDGNVALSTARRWFLACGELTS